MRIGGLTMLRSGTMIGGLILALLILPGPVVLAAERSAPAGLMAGRMPRFAPVGHIQRPAFHAGANRHLGRRFAGHAFGRHHGRRYPRVFNALGSGFYPFFTEAPAIASHAVEDVPGRADGDSFETMRVAIGIPPAPTPEPTLYRLEGPRNRPVARVIRIGEPEPRNGQRSRYTHAETGALLLTVPERRRR
jgi:hypothetical protein